MASRGKVLLQLALQIQQARARTSDSTPELPKGINRESRVQEDNANNAQTMLCKTDGTVDTVNGWEHKDNDSDILFATKVDDNNNHGYENDASGLMCYESDVDSNDNDVRDPDWNPSKHDLVETESDEDGDVVTQIQTISHSSDTGPVVPNTLEVETQQEEETYERIDHEEIVVTGDNQGKRKHKGESNWKRNVQKRLRMEGKEFQGLKKSEGKYIETSKSERILTERGCSKRCYKAGKNRNCHLFTDEVRKEIFETFWSNLDWHGKRVLVSSLVDRKIIEGDTKRRTMSCTYHLKYKGTKVPVCKSMFLSTLGIGEKMMYGWLNDTNPNAGTPNRPETKRRGKLKII